MGQDPLLLSLPFVTRDMLAFEGSVTFGLTVESKSTGVNPITISGATRDGPFTLQVIPLNTKALKTDAFSLPNVPLWISVASADSGNTANSTYAAVSLSINGDDVLKLVAGYIYARKTISWPAANIESSAPIGVGRITSVGSADPAAGAELSITVPSGEIWKILAVKFTLVTGAAAANRVPHIVFTNFDGGSFDSISSFSQIISTTKTYHGIPIGGAGVYTDDDDVIIPIPPSIYLDGAGTITTETTAKNALDNYGSFNIWVERFYV